MKLMWIFKAADEIRREAMGDSAYEEGHGEDAARLIVADTCRYAAIIVKHFGDIATK